MLPHQTKKSLTRFRLFAYALPVIPVNFLAGPLTILQGIYAKYFGLSLASIASVLLIARLFDAISDPMIGFLSDRFYARSGSRKQFVVCGGVLLILACYFLYVPPVDVSSVYFLGWFLAFYFAFTMFEIPHLAWASDLVSDSQGKKHNLWLASCLFNTWVSHFFCCALVTNI